MGVEDWHKSTTEFKFLGIHASLSMGNIFDALVRVFGIILIMSFHVYSMLYFVYFFRHFSYVVSDILTKYISDWEFCLHTTSLTCHYDWS